MFIAICSEPKILPFFKACLKFFCQTNQWGASFSKQNTPIFKCGLRATSLDT
jgi:hypothetical protein